MPLRKPSFPPAQTGLRLLPIVLAVLLTACASLPSANTSASNTLAAMAPAQWSTAPANADKAATDVATWWHRFSDPQLNALVTQALQNNTSIHAAQAALRQARAQVDVQNAALGPSLAASGSAQRNQTGSSSGSSSGSNRFQLGFDTSWEPDIFGSNRSSATASEADAQASAANLANAHVSLAAEVAANYITLRSLQARLAIAQNNLLSQQETLQIVRWRVQAGLASSLDAEQLIGSVEQTRAQLPALQASATQAMNALAILTGQPPGALQSALSELGPVPAAPADLALAFPAETLLQRPDVRAAASRVDAAMARVAVAEAERHPNFKLSGSLGLSALTLGTLTDSASLVRALLASFSVPLYDGGARDAQLRSQEAALDQARSNGQGTVLTALQEVEDALASLRGNQDRLERLQASAVAANNADALARQRYQSGLIDFATVLTTQRTVLSAQDSLASAQASLSTDHVKLYKALGGGWQPNPPASTKP